MNKNINKNFCCKMITQSSKWYSIEENNKLQDVQLDCESYQRFIFSHERLWCSVVTQVSLPITFSIWNTMIKYKDLLTEKKYKQIKQKSTISVWSWQTVVYNSREVLKENQYSKILMIGGYTCFTSRSLHDTFILLRVNRKRIIIKNCF